MSKRAFDFIPLAEVFRGRQDVGGPWLPRGPYSARLRFFEVIEASKDIRSLRSVRPPDATRAKAADA